MVKPTPCPSPFLCSQLDKGEKKRQAVEGGAHHTCAQCSRRVSALCNHPKALGRPSRRLPARQLLCPPPPLAWHQGLALGQHLANKAVATEQHQHQQQHAMCKLQAVLQLVGCLCDSLLHGLLHAVPLCRYPSVCVFRHHNLRNELFKDLREQLKDTSK
jgi:hypothetical protein